jgi:hypothetical protein
MEGMYRGRGDRPKERGLSGGIGSGMGAIGNRRSGAETGSGLGRTVVG